MIKPPNPMQKALEGLKNAPKCLAYARTTGKPCKNASMSNGRCRMHGGKSTGRPATHGQRTIKNLKNQIEVKAILKSLDSIQDISLRREHLF
jgi:hypothetical protein